MELQLPPCHSASRASAKQCPLRLWEPAAKGHKERERKRGSNGGRYRFLRQIPLFEPKSVSAPPFFLSRELPRS